MTTGTHLNKGVNLDNPSFMFPRLTDHVGLDVRRSLPKLLVMICWEGDRLDRTELGTIYTFMVYRIII